eukprot:1182221-Prorocentrum_minimum.AAC.1
MEAVAMGGSLTGNAHIGTITNHTFVSRCATTFMVGIFCDTLMIDSRHAHHLGVLCCFSSRLAIEWPQLCAKCSGCVTQGKSCGKSDASDTLKIVSMFTTLRHASRTYHQRAIFSS